MNETFEQMALRVAKEKCGLWLDPEWDDALVAYATRIRDELYKGQEPVAWATTLKNDELGLWPTKAEAEQYCDDQDNPVPLYSAPIPADMVLMPKEPTAEMIEAGNDGFRNPDSRRHTVSSCYKAMIAAYEKEIAK